jgi:hypothetical protein
MFANMAMHRGDSGTVSPVSISRLNHHRHRRGNTCRPAADAAAGGFS